MKLKYRIMKNNMGEYYTQYFEGVWIFGTWKIHTSGHKTEQEAQDAIMEYATMVFITHDKVIKRITIE